MAFASPRQPQQPPPPTPHPQQQPQQHQPMTSTSPSQPLMSTASRRLLIFQETRNPHNATETVYLPVNKLGLPICGSGPVPALPSILELPLRVLRAFTDIFNQPKYKGWAVVAAGPYRDMSEHGTFYAVVLEQARELVVAAPLPSSATSASPQMQSQAQGQGPGQMQMQESGMDSR